MEVRGRVALVTGAAAGTGREIAPRLGVDGALVVVADVDLQAGQETARAIELQGGSAWYPPQRKSRPVSWVAPTSQHIPPFVLL